MHVNWMPESAPWENHACVNYLTEIQFKLSKWTEGLLEWLMHLLEAGTTLA